MRRVQAAALLAAALVLSGGAPRSLDLRAELQGLTAHRAIRLRLSLPTAFAPCEESTPPSAKFVCAGSALPRLGAPLQAAYSAAESEPGPEATHLRALVPMVAAGPSRQAVDRSLDRLGAALNARPDEPGLLNDAAVAHALRADLSNNPRDLLLALDLLDRALRVAPDHAPARFNRALVLTAMPLSGGAEIAWKHYLELPDESGYRDEAHRALGAVRSTLGTAATPERLRRLAEEARDGTIEPLFDLVASDPQRARELGMEHLLPAWAGARRTGDLAGADRLLTAARRLGRRLEDANGECSLASMVEEIDAASGPAALERLAGTHVDYAEASRLFVLLRSEEASPGFDRVDRHAGGGALGLWARMGIGAVHFSRNDYPAAVATFEWLTSVTDDGCLRALAGRAAWGLGVTRLRQGHYVAALRHLRRAEALFLALDERENLGAIRHLLATTHHQLGRDDEVWGLYFEALAALGRDRGSLRLHSLLWESARAAEASLGPRAALVLQEEVVRNATAAENQGLLPEALLWRARFRTAVGDTEGALEDLEAARRWNDRRPPGPAPARIAADLSLARGLALASRSEPAALGELSAALDYYVEENQAIAALETRLARARLLRRIGQPRRALADVEAGLDMLRQQRDAVADNLLRRSFTESVQAAFEEALELSIDDLGIAPEESLRLAEEARDVPYGWTGTTPQAPGARRTVTDVMRVLGDATLVVHASTAHRLYLWRIDSGGVELTVRRQPREAVEARARSYAEALRHGAGEATLADESRALHALLLPNAVSDLDPGTVLYVVPDRILSALPFDLLRDPRSGRHLIARHPLAYAPSLRSLVASLYPERGPVSPSGVLVIADPAHDRELFPTLPALPDTRRQVNEIAALYPASDRLTGPDATPDAVLAHLDSQPVLHYSGHAVFDAAHPTLSFLPLAPSPAGDSTLFADALAARQLHELRLVVLSACSSLGPSDHRTVAISGIARPFLDAGAGAVVGTLWPVTEDDAGRLLTDFHRRFLDGGDAVRALHEAKLARFRDTTDPHPTRWAAFQIVGQAITK